MATKTGKRLGSFSTKSRSGSIGGGSWNPMPTRDPRRRPTMRDALALAANTGVAIAQSASPIATYSGSTSAGSRTYGASSGSTSSGSTSSGSTSSGQTAAQRAAVRAAAAEAKATARTNRAARNSASAQRTSILQDIDESRSQKTTNQRKLDALKELVGGDLAKSRDTNLAAIAADLKLLLDPAMSNYNDTIGGLNTTLRDNESAEADASFSNMANRGRETQDVVTQALSQGAGESDVLKTQLQALRNWNQNQSDINRSYFDTLTSTNSAIEDLNVGTKNTMQGYELDANQRRGDQYKDYYDAMADSYTQMDNLASNNFLLDQEIAANQANLAEQDALLKWLDAGKNAEDYEVKDTKKTNATSKAARQAFTGYAAQAADFAGRSWKNPGVSKETKNWEGQETQVNPLASSQAWAAQTNQPTRKRPEGATLRRW